MREAPVIAFMILVIVGMVWFDSHSYGSAYERGRKDKHAEIMEFMTGDRQARIAIVSHKGIEYHESGMCAECHGG